jgi:tetratricopeptide (TPR) repeat protein
MGGQKQDIDIFGIDILDDMFRAFASGIKTTVAMHAQLSTSSLEIWIEHMNVQQCIYFSRLKQFQKYAISAIAGSSSQKAIELWQLVRRLLSTKFLAAIQVDSYLKWSAQTEMSLMELRDCDQEIALSSWVCQYQYGFKRSDLDETYRDSTHWARMGHYLCNINAAGTEENAESWIKASVIFARVCRWKRNFKTSELIISKVLAQYPTCQQALFEKAKALEKSQDYAAAAGIYGQVMRSSTDHNLANEMKARANIAMTKLCKRRHWQAACSLLQEFDCTIHCQNESDYSSAITRLYESASNLAPEWPKVWFLYGTHCYRYGWQLLEDIKSRRGATMVTQEVLQIAQNALYAEAGSKQATKDLATVCAYIPKSAEMPFRRMKTKLSRHRSVVSSPMDHSAGIWMMNQSQGTLRRTSKRLFRIYQSRL